MFRISCIGFILLISAVRAGAVDPPVVHEYDDRIVIEYDGSKSPDASPPLPVDGSVQDPPVSYDPPPVLEEPVPPPVEKVPDLEPPQSEPPDTMGR
jgi:hypothetical protein